MKHFKYALEGIRKGAGLLGSAAGGVLFFLGILAAGYSKPFDHILSYNSLLSNSICAVISAMAGMFLLCIIRIFWAPFHFVFQPEGGFGVAMKRRFGVPLWPLVTLATMIWLSSVIVAGAICTYIITSFLPPPARLSLPSAYVADIKLGSVDKPENRRFPRRGGV